ncbi:MAG TPA: flippase [Caldilineaceae bacterium]|nr:flippase [Caldilineaceae bacterium]
MSQLHSTPSSSLPDPQQTGRRILINTGALAGSSLWRIVMSFLLQLLIARQLGVVSLGQYTIVLAYLHLCQVISELGLPTLLVRDLAQMPWLRRSYFYLTLRIQGIAALLVWAGLIGATTVLPLPEITRTLLWIAGASLPFYAITSVCQMLFQSGERMEYVMVVDTSVNTSILGLSLGALLVGGDTRSLVAILVLTQMLSAALGLYLVRRSALLSGPQEPVAWQWSMLWQRSGPFLGLALADVMLQRIDIVLLSIFAGELLVGIYSAAYNLLRVALKLIQNFWAALYPTLSRLYHQSPTHYRRLTNFALHYSLLALLAVAAIGVGITPVLLQFVYGNDFLDSAHVLQILLWTAPFYLLESYTQTVLMVERHPLHSLLISGVHLVTLALLLPLLVSSAPTLFMGNSLPAIGALGAAIAVLVASALGAAMSIHLQRRWQLPGRLRHGWRVALLVLVSSLFSLYGPLHWLARVVLNGLLFLVGGWLSRVVVYEDWQQIERVLRRGKRPQPANSS